MVQPLASPSPACPQDWSWIWMRSPGRWPDGPRGRSALSTARREDDQPEILSGVFEGKTTGAPLCAVIANTDTRSQDYTRTKDLARPGHADYPARVRYQGYNDYRGGGHFSGRLTAPLVFAGAVAKQILGPAGVFVGAHISSVYGISDQLLEVGTACGLWRTRTFLCWMTRPGSRCGRLF